MKRLLLVTSIVCLAVAMIATNPASAETWDLANDWSDVNNPNGPWVIALDGWIYGPNQWTVSPITNHVDAWSVEASEDWTGNQPAWQNPTTPGGLSSGAAKSVGVSAYDFPEGKVGIHTPTWVVWIAPRETDVTVSGGVWRFRDTEEAWYISMAHFDMTLWTMSELTGSSLMPTRAAGWTSDNPYTFENMATAGGKTWPGLIHVKSGDRLIFVNQYAYGNTSYSDFVGIDFTISEVPEPGAMVSLGSGLIGLLGFALRRRR